MRKATIEGQNKINTLHILDLQKDKSNLIDENKVLKQNLEDSEIVNKSLTDRVANLEYQLEGRDNEIKELKTQIEKMKCCKFCKHRKSDYDKEPCDTCKLGFPQWGRQGMKDKWEFDKELLNE